MICLYFDHFKMIGRGILLRLLFVMSSTIGVLTQQTLSCAEDMASNVETGECECTGMDRYATQEGTCVTCSAPDQWNS